MHGQDLGAETPRNGQIEQVATSVVVEESARRQSLVGAVWGALRQARIERLEARLHRLRRATRQPSCGYDRPLLLGAAEPSHERPGDVASSDTLSTQTALRARSWWFMGGGAAVFMMMSVLHGQIGGTGADAEDLQAVLREVATLRGQVDAQAASVDALGQRFVAVAQQASDAASQLTSQTSVLSTYGQQLDAQTAQLARLGEAMATVAEQIHGLDQKITVHETQIITHEKQLATQATQLSALRSRTSAATPPPVAVTATNPGPPTLEAFTAPPRRTATAKELNTATGTASSRPVISLPAGLGAAGLRGRPGSQQGAPP